MRYYLKKCGFQELGSVTNGKPQRGRYLLTSMNTDVLSIFPALSISQLNDSALLPVIPLYSGKKVYCSYVYHNDKFHGSSVKHPRNEYRIYLNKALEEDKLLLDTNDIVIIRPQIIGTDEETQTVYYFDFVKNDGSTLYEKLERIISDYPIKGGYGLYDGEIPEFERKVNQFADTDECVVEIDDSVTKIAEGSNDAVSSLFNAVSFRDFVMVGYNNLCAVTGTVIRYDNYMNLEAAHIKPRSHGGLYLPNNGMALCRDMHWAFDKGFFTLDDDLKIVVHPKINSDFLNHYNGKKIRVPTNQFFVPDLSNVKYHRENVYGLFLQSGRL